MISGKYSHTYVHETYKCTKNIRLYVNVLEKVQRIGVNEDGIGKSV